MRDTSAATHPRREGAAVVRPLGDLCFIETQFPVSKMSKESYKERKANYSQTLTGLGKWWGRKPLVLCRATILGLLLPVTNNPRKDRDVFLRLMTMDDDGMLRRKTKSIPATELFKRLPPTDRDRYFEQGSDGKTSRLKRGLSRDERDELQKRVFLSLSYDERLEYCDRPEQINGPSPESWQVINRHLVTNAASLRELVEELGKRRFGHVPRVGDAFCGGGSIPFEAARLGCEAYGSDLNPVAALLTWAALNIVGGGPEVARQVRAAQEAVYNAVDKQVTLWGIEHRSEDIAPQEWGDLMARLERDEITPDDVSRTVPRADAYLYCVEVICPETGWLVPLAPSWVIGEKTRTVAILEPEEAQKRYRIRIKSGASGEEMKAARTGTAQGKYIVHPILKQMVKNPATIDQVRLAGKSRVAGSRYHENGLRLWENDDVVPLPEDVFQERLYCVRWVQSWREWDDRKQEWKEKSERFYAEPIKHDLAREAKSLALLRERFSAWQEKGFIPARRIESGYNTNQPIRERGWTYWHHLFNPTQLLVYGEALRIAAIDKMKAEQVSALLGMSRCVDWTCRLTWWDSSAANEKVSHVFYNQALNTQVSMASRGWRKLNTNWFLDIRPVTCFGSASVCPGDARQLEWVCDVWLTDPPYADAINYHELSEFFLAWYERPLKRLFPDWPTDSRRALAVTGSDESFRKSMVDCYRNLVAHMPDDGMQVVMFTHQDASVWADLSLILWAAGLRVTAAWCIATETDSALKQGNYVQGTVLLVLRKQKTEETAFLDEVYHDVEAEVRRQIDSMRDMDDVKDPNFGDTDYQLAAYAAALRVLTAKIIEEIDVAYELTRTRAKGEKSPVEELIRKAVQIACDHLVPRGIDRHLWKSLSAVEHFYLKGLELESHGEHRVGVYQELARGFGLEEYKPLLASTKANETRLKTATEFGHREMGDSGFGSSVVRHALFAACKTAETEDTRDGITWLKTEVQDYATNRQRIMDILEYLATFRQNSSLSHWHKDAEAAGLLSGALRNREDNV